MIYTYFPHKAWISINSAPSDVQQPVIASVSRQIRQEALAVFYSNNHFVLDLRGWKDASYPKLWKPADIFESWIYAIGDVNAANLRSLKIFAYVFAAFERDHKCLERSQTVRCTIPNPSNPPCILEILLHADLFTQG